MLTVAYLLIIISWVVFCSIYIFPNFVIRFRCSVARLVLVLDEGRKLHSATNEKGTSVRVRDYTRSCESKVFSAQLYMPLPLWGGKAASGLDESEDLPIFAQV